MKHKIDQTNNVSSYEQGHIKLHRSLLESSLWLMRPEDMKLAIFLLLRANWREREMFSRFQQKRITVKRGELITSIENMALGTGLSKQNVRTSIKHLVQDGFILILNLAEKSTRQFTHIKVCKYEFYQRNDEPSNTASTQHQHSTNTASTTTEEYKEGKEGKELYKPPTESGDTHTQSPLSSELSLFKEVAGFLPDDCKVQERIEQAIKKNKITKIVMQDSHTAWHSKGYRTQNLDWLFDWAISGIPKSKRKEEITPRVTSESMQVMDYLNVQYCKKFTAISFHQQINELLKKGYTVKQIKTTIDYRYDELESEGQEEINKWFKPQIIFKVENFEGYFNSAYTTNWNHKNAN